MCDHLMALKLRESNWIINYSCWRRYRGGLNYVHYDAIHGELVACGYGSVHDLYWLLRFLVTGTYFENCTRDEEDTACYGENAFKISSDTENLYPDIIYI